MTKHITSIILAFLFPLLLLAQKNIEGAIIDATSNAPIAYANIGLLNKNIGTVSNANGHFSLLLPSKTLGSDTVRISFIGYETKDYSFQAFENLCKKNCTISLTPTDYNFNEVVIMPKDFIEKIVGNTTTNKNISVSFENNNMGHEMGVRMKIKKRPTFIERIDINIAHTTYDSIFYRMNIYKFDTKKGKPTEHILKKPVYLVYAKADTENTISVDLSAMNVFVEDDFFVSLELVKDLGEGDLNFCAALFKSKSYYRYISQGRWTKAPISIGASISAAIRQEK